MEIKILNVQPTKNVFYTVDFGDTFESIAHFLCVPKEYIIQNNPGELYEGKVLFLPETNFKSYTVQPFDTLQKIANINGTTIEALKSKNNLTSEYVFVGQKLYL